MSSFSEQFIHSHTVEVLQIALEVVQEAETKETAESVLKNLIEIKQKQIKEQ